MRDKDGVKYTDFSNIETGRNYLIPEEFPEGAYGSSIGKQKLVENKSTPWKEGQRHYSAFNYENKTLHEDIPRQMEGAHPPHDNPDVDNETPYSNVQQ